MGDTSPVGVLQWSVENILVNVSSIFSVHPNIVMNNLMLWK